MRTYKRSYSESRDDRVCHCNCRSLRVHIAQAGQRDERDGILFRKEIIRAEKHTALNNHNTRVSWASCKQCVVGNRSTSVP